MRRKRFQRKRSDICSLTSVLRTSAPAKTEPSFCTLFKLRAIANIIGFIIFYIRHHEQYRARLKIIEGAPDVGIE